MLKVVNPQPVGADGNFPDVGLVGAQPVFCHVDQQALSEACVGTLRSLPVQVALDIVDGAGGVRECRVFEGRRGRQEGRVIVQGYLRGVEGGLLPR